MATLATVLTGLDLSTHDDRLVADLSLYVYQMLRDRESTDVPAGGAASP